MANVTRLAPSPTGLMHIGTARTGMFNWLAARATGGEFILRIDDTDADRNMVEAEQPILDGLRWLGLEWDRFERQSARAEIHASYAKRLLAAGLAIEADNGAILLKWPQGMRRAWMDEIAGPVAVSDKVVEENDGKLVLARGGDKLGQATYQFASILDDFLMGVNFVIRGVDHISNTGKQLAIWHALGELEGRERPRPRFAHVGLIFKDGKKMSKRDGAASLLDYRDKGYDPDGVFNFLLRLGWGPKVDDKASTFMDRRQATDLFLEGGRMRSSNASFDQAKLDFYDRRWKQRKHREAAEAAAPAP